MFIQNKLIKMYKKYAYNCSGISLKYIYAYTKIFVFMATIKFLILIMYKYIFNNFNAFTLI